MPSEWTDDGITLTGEELRLVTAAAAAEGITIEEFVNLALIRMLDNHDPYWRHRVGE